METRDEEAVIETTRLALEPLQPSHATELYTVLASPEVYRYIAADAPSDLTALTARYVRLATRRSPDGSERWLNWAVRVRATARCVGRVEATVRGAEAEIAYLFAPEVQGCGYATEACRAMVERLAAGYGVARIEATIDPRNKRSIALAERLGLAWVETVKDGDVIRGEACDEARYRVRL